MKTFLYATCLVVTMIARVQAASIASIAQLDTQPNPLSAASIGSLAQLVAQPEDFRGMMGWNIAKPGSKQWLLYDALTAVHHSMFPGGDQVGTAVECIHSAYTEIFVAKMKYKRRRKEEAGDTYKLDHDVDMRKFGHGHELRIKEGIAEKNRELKDVLAAFDEKPDQKHELVFTNGK